MRDKIGMQVFFCTELVERLAEDYQENKGIESPWYGGLANKTQMQGDIRRLRRELIKLHKMLGGDSE